MPPSQALSVRDDLIVLVVLDSDAAYYKEVFDEAVRALQRVSDRAQPEDLSIARVHIDGFADLYGGEMQTAQALIAALPTWLAPRAGVASSKFPAYAAARIALDNPRKRVPRKRAVRDHGGF